MVPIAGLPLGTPDLRNDALLSKGVKKPALCPAVLKNPRLGDPVSKERQQTSVALAELEQLDGQTTRPVLHRRLEARQIQ